MSRFPKHLRDQYAAVDQANINHATQGNETTTETKTYAPTLPGDTAKLRGIPAIGRNVTGAIPGTNPGSSLQ